MNYHGPREIKEGPNAGKFHYTCTNDGAVWPEGYCSPWEPCPDCGDEYPGTEERRACETCSGKGIVERAEPCPGHGTKDEACEHYRQYLLDKADYQSPTFESDRERIRAEEPCEVPGCKAFATATARFGHLDDVYLCADHLNREGLSLARPTVGESFGSY